MYNPITKLHKVINHKTIDERRQTTMQILHNTSATMAAVQQGINSSNYKKMPKSSEAAIASTLLQMMRHS